MFTFQQKKKEEKEIFALRITEMAYKHTHTKKTFIHNIISTASRQVETSYWSTIYGKTFSFLFLSFSIPFSDIYNSTTGQICVQCITTLYSVCVVALRCIEDEKKKENILR